MAEAETRNCRERLPGNSQYYFRTNFRDKISTKVKFTYIKGKKKSRVPEL